jgi:DNA repair protein RecN (Recombination protein N)
VLASLEIKNYAIIEHVILKFDEKLNIITGETGAGKSILLGALGLTLGERADTKALFDKENKCFVEAVFILKNNHLKDFFEANELDYETEIHVRREISPSGKSRAFINDTPVTLQLLKSLTEQLVNLHSQQETLLLNEQGFQIAVIDFAAHNAALLAQYQTELKNYKSLQKHLTTLQNEAANSQKDYDFNLFQLRELEEAKLENEDLDLLENEWRILNHAEEIKTKLFEVVNGLDNDEFSALGLLINSSKNLHKLSAYSVSLQGLSDRLESVLLELEDIKKEAQTIAQNTDFDEERILFLSEKISITNKLLLKHQKSNIAELMELKASFEEKTLSLADLTNFIAKTENELAIQEKTLAEAAKKLSDARKKVHDSVSQHIITTLQKIGMPNAQFLITQTPKTHYDTLGKDEIHFLFSANKGFEPQELSKIASGGELSRVMLSIKYLLAGSTALPTLIFDEIDTGISGEIAAKVGEVFQAMSSKHQLISITHLPQIAAKANKHFFIYKEDGTEKTKTKIASLNAEQHVKAIARMLSGNTISEASLENARLLIG